MADIKECFIIMPITTPEGMISEYRDGIDHFQHVLDCLFIPSIEKAGFKPKPPKAEGSDLIHSEIIKNLETADIVLCDMSCLNPNVFFEFGIRTSLNKPVCVVKDELIKKVPFDTGILNYQEYNSLIEPWNLPAEIEKMATHIKTSADRSKGANTMWKLFGFKSEAVPYAVESGTDPRLDYLTMRMDSLLRMMDEIANSSKYASSPISKVQKTKIEREELQFIIMGYLPRNVILDKLIFKQGDVLEMRYTGYFPRDERDALRKHLYIRWGMEITFHRVREVGQLERTPIEDIDGSI